ncbi:FimV/HubP family polar landmark protein [Xanthomonas massiliensis]|uniref:FimV/HubP family polar landmark protein n=1 Tax=Xanthomonas massiliensis TaxID=1720302 RepID=UPI00098EF43D|nr:FimV/HubP family polar landmark protein [Xanthomonas massiliensis]
MRTRDRRVRRAIQGLGALTLALCSGASLALGLGDIRVLSRPGQPLLAEIPVISNEPGELDDARVALASPDTFARVGLERPQGLVENLHFEFAQDRQGHAVIRVTSAAPVDAPALSFLIEVDWGQGRLVREYSALVDAPQSAVTSAAAIQAPQALPSDRIAAPPEDLPGPASASAPSAVPDEDTAAPPPPPAPRPARVAIGAGADGALPPVRAGQTLSEIALGLARGSGHGLDQTMMALLQANPQAFIGGNINRLRQGAILRTPRQDELARIGAAEARAMVREQAAQWRQARAAIPQPAVDGNAAPAAAAAGTTAAGARLEIAPAVAGGGKGEAGAASGTTPGGEGDMADNAELRQTREDLATRDAELQELRTRVGELEKLQKKQQDLIALKDTELASANKRLAESNAGTGAAGGWLWGGLVLVLAAAGAWVLSRRRKPSPLPPLREIDPQALAAAVPAPVQPAAEADADVDAEAWAAAHAASEVPGPEAGPAAEETAADDIAAATGHDQAPVREVPLLPVPPPGDGPDAAELAPLNPAPAGRERLELAVAYMDLGDTETARSLLSEVAHGNDPQARAEAIDLLDRLG